MSRRTALALVLVIAVAAALRLPRLGRVPNGLIPDEALSAYDAFSILNTGHDQHGERLPLFPLSTARLSSVYMYATVPSVALLGLTETAARLPAALAGIATVAALFALVREAYGPGAALLSALLLAISPWHVLITRTGFEWAMLPALATLALVLLTRGAWLLASLCAGLALYSYAPGRVLVPMLLLAFALVRRSRLRRKRRAALAAAAILAVMATPVAVSMAAGGGLQRLESVRDADGGVRSAAARYAAAFDPSFLTRAAEGPELHRLRSVGLMYAFELPLVALGIVRVVRDRSPVGLLLLVWLLWAPLTVAVHKDSPDPILGSTSLPAPQGLAGIGGAWVLGRLGRWRVPAVLGALAVAAVAAFGAARDLYLRYPVESAPAWSYGAREMVGRIEALRAPAEEVLVDGRWKLMYSLILFYTREDPRARQAEVARLEGRSERSRVGPYRIGDISRAPSSSLVWTDFDTGQRLFPETSPIHVVRMPDGTAGYTLWRQPPAP
ncbi:MAG TPA: glycosyltransferase family 39 protein [Vicinamibacteria bacterium]|nr:glycosyltransferase family 39 protein [Vicinamibacteria bacterium]